MAKPVTWITYKMADGTDIYGEYAFVTEPDFFEDVDEPTKVIKETWQLLSSEELTFGPEELEEEE